VGTLANALGDKGDGLVDKLVKSPRVTISGVLVIAIGETMRQPIASQKNDLGLGRC
jgi:hypothetical protein